MNTRTPPPTAAVANECIPKGPQGRGRGHCDPPRPRASCVTREAPSEQYLEMFLQNHPPTFNKVPLSLERCPELASSRGPAAASRCAVGYQAAFGFRPR